MDKALTIFENWTLFLTVMAGLISMTANVILRYGFNHSLAWSEEFIREVIMYTTFIGCSVAIRNRNMIVIDALPQLVPILKAPLVFITHASTLVFCAVITYLGWKMMVLQYVTKQTTVTMEIPTAVLYVMLPMMGVFMAFRTLQSLYQDVKTYILKTA
ncbi:MAG: TRAP transporter small permease [Thermodesulfobacteriota bacterium]